MLEVACHLGLTCALALALPAQQAPTKTPSPATEDTSVRDQVVDSWQITEYRELLGQTVVDATWSSAHGLCVLSFEALTTFDGWRWRRRSLPDCFVPDFPRRLLARGRGTLVIAGNTKIVEIDGDDARLLWSSPKTPLAIKGLAEDQRGRIWAATAHGAMCIGEGRARLFTSESRRLALLTHSLGDRLTIEPLAQGFWARHHVKRGLGVQLVSGPGGTTCGYIFPGGPAELAGLRPGDSFEVLKPKKAPYSVRTRRGNQTRIVKLAVNEKLDAVYPRPTLTGLCIEGDGRLCFSMRGGLLRHDTKTGSWTVHRLPVERTRTEIARGSSKTIAYGDMPTLYTLSDTGAITSTPTISKIGSSQVGELPTGELISLDANGAQLHVSKAGAWQRIHLPRAEDRYKRFYITNDALWLIATSGLTSRIELPLSRGRRSGFRTLCETSSGLVLLVDTKGALHTAAHARATETTLAPAITRLTTYNSTLSAGDRIWVLGQAKNHDATLLSYDDGAWRRERLDGKRRFHGARNEIFVSKEGELFVGPLSTGSNSSVIFRRPKGSNTWVQQTTSKLLYGRGFCQSEDGRIFVGATASVYELGRERLRLQLWGRRPTPRHIECLTLGPDGRPWLFDRTLGCICLDGESWVSRTELQRIPQVTEAVFSSALDQFWAWGPRTVLRYDGRQLQSVLHEDEAFDLVVGPNNVFLNRRDAAGRTLSTRVLVLERVAPNTRFAPCADSIQFGQSAVVSWMGHDRWHPDRRLDFSWRLNGGPWSEWSDRTSLVVSDLPLGAHSIDVRARDMSLNVEQVPARFELSVSRPLFQRPWFVASILVLLFAAVAQTLRVVRRDRQLQVDTARADAAEAARDRLEDEVRARQEAEHQRGRLESQLLQAQKLEAVGRLTGGIAHDFNNLLTAILGHADCLRLRLAKQAEIDVTQLDRSLDGLSDAAERATQLTRQLLMIGRRKALQPEVFDVGRAITDLEDMLRRVIEEDVAFEIETGDEQTLVCMDRSMFEQVLMNLVVNARDATAPHGRIAVSVATAKLTEAKPNSSGLVAPGEYVVLCVTDDGCGIDAASMPMIFEPFWSTKDREQGSGLGLSTVIAIVEQCGGFIDVQSEEGQGATFCAWLPRTEGTPSPRPAPTIVSPERMQGRVLLCEDNDLVRDLAATTLEEQGLEVESTATAEDALERAQTTERFDLLITDIILPGKDGLTLAAELRERDSELPVLYMSGYAEQVLNDRGVLLEGMDLLEKPFAPHVLCARVASAIHSQLNGHD